MGIQAFIEDGAGKGTVAHVSSRGQLVVGPLEFSDAYAVEVDTINTAFNFVPPEPNKRFVITDMLLYANKGVGANDASVQVYEATSATSTTVTKAILDIEMLKNSARDITGLNLLITEGRWVNIKTDDNTIFATLMGYYITA